MNILMFKLKNGVDIIAEVENATTKYYELHTPYQIVPIDSFDDDGLPKSTMIILNQWLMFAKETMVKLNKNDIMIVCTPNKFLVHMYITRRAEDETHPPKTGFSYFGGAGGSSKGSTRKDIFGNEKPKSDQSDDDFGDLGETDTDDNTFDDRGDDPFFNDGPKN